MNEQSYSVTVFCHARAAFMTTELKLSSVLTMTGFFLPANSGSGPYVSVIYDTPEEAQM